MKKLFKSIVAVMLCAVIAVSALGTETAQAADDQSIKVTFGKKSVKFKVTEDGVKEIKYKTLKKKLGKATSIDHDDYEEMDYYCTTYKWEKGKTCISYVKEIMSGNIGSGHFYNIKIEDKNGTICGVTAGTKASKAKKAFKKAGATVEKDENSIFAEFNNGCRIQCSLKNGKISKIYADLYY